jgi:small subunit ribosomal protein S6
LKSYECTIIVMSGVGDDGLKISARKYAEAIENGGGELTQLENWGKRRFSYIIDHQAEGYYIFFRMRCGNNVLDELNRLLRLDESVLRHLIIRDEIAIGDEPKIEIEAVLAGGINGKEEI